MPVYHGLPRTHADRRTPPRPEQWAWFEDTLNGRTWDDVGWEHCWPFLATLDRGAARGVICYDIGDLAPNEYGDAPVIDFGFAVDPQCRGRGMGRLMIKRLLLEFPGYIIHCDAISPATRYLCAELGFYFQPATGPHSYVLFPEDNLWHSSCPSPAPPSTSTR